MNRGCIPVKALVRSAEIIHLGRRFAEFGIKQSPVVADFEQIFLRKERIVSKLYDGEKLLRDRGIDLIRGSASFVSDHEIEVDGELFDSERFIIASGSAPAVPAIPGLMETGFWTSNEAISPDRQPNTLAVIGGSAVGSEMAQLYSRFGSRVTVIEMMPRLIAGEEPELGDELARIFAAEGIETITGANVTRIESATIGKRVIFHYSSAEENTLHSPISESQVVADEILIAVGRVSDLTALDLEKAGVQYSEKGIDVDANLRTSQAHIWACGDAIGDPMLAHFASREGRIAGENCMADQQGLALKKTDYSILARAVFTDPPIASAGLGEQEAARLPSGFLTGFYTFKETGRAACMGETEGFVKIVADRETRKLVGCHIIGPAADVLIHEASLAIAAGVTVEQLQGPPNIHIHPTLSEAVGWAAGEMS